MLKTLCHPLAFVCCCTSCVWLLLGDGEQCMLCLQGGELMSLLRPLSQTLLVDRTHVWRSANYPPVLFLVESNEGLRLLHLCVCVTSLGELSSLIQMQDNTNNSICGDTEEAHRYRFTAARGGGSLTQGSSVVTPLSQWASSPIRADVTLPLKAADWSFVQNETATGLKGHAEQPRVQGASVTFQPVIR